MKFLPVNFYLFVLLVLSMFSCSKETTWNSIYKVPLASGNLGFSDLSADSSVRSNDSGLIVLEFNKQISLDSLGSILTVPDTVSQRVANLQSLKLEDKELNDTIPLKDLYPQSIFLDGQSVQLPSLEITQATTQNIDVSETFFKEAIFSKGIMKISIFNDLPVGIEVLEFSLKNASNGEVIAKDTFKNIAPSTYQIKSFDLANKKVEGILNGEVSYVKTKASVGNVVVEVNKGIRVKIEVLDLNPISATAVFPAQNLITDVQSIYYDLGGPELTFMALRSGKILIDAVSTIEEEIVLSYDIPYSEDTKRNMQPISIQQNVPPAPPNGISNFQSTYDVGKLTGVSLKDSQQNVFPVPTNTIYNIFSSRMVYSGKMRSISLEDSVLVTFGFVNMVPELAIGNFLTKNYRLIQSNQLSDNKFFGEISLESARVNLLITNSYGIQSELKINEIVGYNSQTKNSVVLSAPALEKTLLIDRASNPPLRPYVLSIPLDQSNSNIKPFLENIPNEISIDASALTAPNGHNDYTDFAFYDSDLTLDLQVEIPMIFNAKNFGFEQRISLEKLDYDIMNNIEGGQLILEAENTLPFDLQSRFVFYNEIGDSLFSLQPIETNSYIASGKIDTQTKKVKKSSFSTVLYPMQGWQILLLKKATEVKIRLELNHQDFEKYPVYDTGKLDFQLKGDFNYASKI